MGEEAQRAVRAAGGPGGGRTALRGTLVTAAATLGSRILGFVRDALSAAFFGISADFGSFTLAWVVPNLFRRLFGEGAVSAAVLPALARAEEAGGRPRTVAVFARFQGVFLLGLCALVAAGEGLIWLLRAGSRDPDDRRFLLLTAILLPYLLPICLAALAGAPQHLAGRFSRPALAPALLNAVWISALLLAWGLTGFSDAMPALMILCAGILAGGLLQWALQWPALRAEGFSLRPVFRYGDGTVRATLRAFAPALLGLAVVQINLAADQFLVRAMVSKAANNYTYLANRLLQLPLALIAISVATGMLPLFSRLSAQGRLEELGNALRRGSELTLLVILAAAGGLFVTALPAVTVLFEHGRVQATDSQVLAATLQAYLWGLPPAAVAGLLTRVRHARGDYRGPAWIAAAVVPVNLLLDVLLLPSLGAPGAGYATSVSLFLQALFLGIGLPSLGVRRPFSWARLPRVAVPGVAATAVAAGTVAALAGGALTVPGFILAVAAGVAVAAVATAWLLPEDFRELRGLLRRGRAPS